FSRDWSSDVCSSDLNKNVDCYYLLGLLVRRGDEYVFEYDLAERPEDEREMWFSFLERVDALDGPVYHYGPYERTAIARLVERHRSEERRVGKERGSQ